MSQVLYGVQENKTGDTNNIRTEVKKIADKISVSLNREEDIIDAKRLER